MDTETIGNRIRRLRTQRSLSLSQLAAIVGVSKDQVWLLETGRTGTPRAGNLAAYAKALGTTESYLVYGVEPTLDPQEPPEPEVLIDMIPDLQPDDRRFIVELVRDRQRRYQEQQRAQGTTDGNGHMSAGS